MGFSRVFHNGLVGLGSVLRVGRACEVYGLTRIDRTSTVKLSGIKVCRVEQLPGLCADLVRSQNLVVLASPPLHPSAHTNVYLNPN